MPLWEKDRKEHGGVAAQVQGGYLRLELESVQLQGVSQNPQQSHSSLGEDGGCLGRGSHVPVSPLAAAVSDPVWSKSLPHVPHQCGAGPGTGSARGELPLLSPWS